MIIYDQTTRLTDTSTRVKPRLMFFPKEQSRFFIFIVCHLPEKV